MNLPGLLFLTVNILWFPRNQGPAALFPETYQVRKRQIRTNWLIVADLVDSLNYRDGNLKHGIRYEYQVRAVSIMVYMDRG